MCVSFESLCIYSNMMQYLYRNTQRDGIGREAGGGIGMGNTCRSMADSCQWMAKTTTIL